MLKVLKKSNVNNFNDWINAVTYFNAIYTFLVGGRNGRKSSKIQTKILNDYFKHGKTFLLIRRKTDETVSENWFTPYVRKSLLEKHNKIITFKKTINKGEKFTGYFYLCDEDEKNPVIIGKVVYLSVEQKYKSNESDLYLKLYNVVYEEFIAKSDRDYLVNEPQTLVNIISTFFRERQAQIYLIGNTLDGQETNPYFRFFELDDLALTVNDIYIVENEYKIKIAVMYIANILPEDIPEYQRISGNTVGTTGEWKQDKHYLEQDIKQIDGNIAFQNFAIDYRNKRFYVYEISEKDYSRPYIFITTQTLKTDVISDFDGFIKTLPPEQQKYKRSYLAFLYPEQFEYSYITHNFEFKKPKIKIDYNVLGIDTQNEKEKSKNNHYKLLERLNEILYNKQLFCDNKSLLFWLQNERKNYIKELVTT